jgi:hypothetical protein
MAFSLRAPSIPAVLACPAQRRALRFLIMMFDQAAFRDETNRA